MKQSKRRQDKKKQNLLYECFHDDFLQIMAKIFRLSRWFGVAGSGNVLWKSFGLCILLVLGVIEGVAIWRVVKALAGLAIDIEGHRSVTARLAGATFYASSITTLILSWKLSSSWEIIALYWAEIERSVAINVSPDKKIRARMITVTYVMVTCVVADYSIWFAVPLLFMSKIATILWNYQDILIVLISMGLTSRYNKLNQYVAKFSTPSKDFPWNPQVECNKGHTWRRIREAYVKQAQLVRRLDETLGGLILLSNLVNFYFICLQLFLGITQGLSGDLTKRMYYVVSLVWLCIRVSCVVLAAADINVHSTKALRHLHASASDKHYYNVEVGKSWWNFGKRLADGNYESSPILSLMCSPKIVRLQNQLGKDYVALTGLGFFSLNRTILLQMAGAIITYELVLIQFDDHGFTEHKSPINSTTF